MPFADPPPPPPRPLTFHLRYRALAAKPVSMLLLVCLIIVIVCAYTARDHFRDWSRIRRLKAIGITAEAQVTEISRQRQRPRGQRGAAREYITFEFRPSDAPQAEPITGRRLHSLFTEQLRLGSRLSIIYDPENPLHFFCLESDDRSLVSQLSLQMFFLIIAAPILLLAISRYCSLLRIARRAPAHRGNIAEIRSSAQGAFSSLVVVTFQLAEQNFVLKRVVPVGLAEKFTVGDSVWLLVPPGRPSRAVVAAAFL